MKINLAKSDIELQKLSPNVDLSAFTCGNNDLDDFLKSDALFYQEVNIAQTVLLCKNNGIVGYFSLTSDSIVLQTREKESFLKEYHQNVYNSTVKSFHPEIGLNSPAL
ncbi:MAG: hypothetical protein QME81_20620, partial [bacterium]|nr:hypothetical protein [bacterium]